MRSFIISHDITKNVLIHKPAFSEANGSNSFICSNVIGLKYLSNCNSEKRLADNTSQYFYAVINGSITTS